MKDIFVARKKENPPVSHGVGVFSSFCQNPAKISFQIQEEDEKILFFLRPHFITNVSWIFTSLVLIAIPLIVFFFFPSFGIPSFFSFLPKNSLILLFLFYALIIFSYLLVNFMNWFYNIYLVTQKRIVDIDYSDLVYHNVAETRLGLVQDVNYAQSGFIRSLFNYGDLYVQTAGTKPNLEALAIPKPSQAAHIIAELIGKGAQLPKEDYAS